MLQSGGDILVYSEPGYGTNFKDLFTASETVPDVPVPAPRVSHAGTETILLVEDEEGVRNLVGRILKGKGYTVPNPPRRRGFVAGRPATGID
ncbi:MAG: hypothetical protein HS126_21885 [Anaerolineales bacterium]|nr:hypothetical protein [Anaerolineales bacterium]